MSRIAPSIAIPEAADPYWNEVLARSGFSVSRLGGPGDPMALFLPDEAGLGSKALRREVSRLRASGTPCVVGCAWGADLLGIRVRNVAAIGISGTGGPFGDGSEIRMPVRVPAFTGASIGRIWPGGEPAVVAIAGPAPIWVLPLASAHRLLAAAARLTALPCGDGRQVHEIVSGVDHGALRRLIVGALKTVCFAAGRPVVRKSALPAGHDAGFAVRVDADGHRAESTFATLAALDSARVRATWFIDVERHLSASGTDAIRAIASAGHEVQSHFFHHYTYRSRAKNHANLLRSLDQLEKLGIGATAAAAPFGTWNPGVASASRTCGLRWSSEFGRVHDDVPTNLSSSAEGEHEPWQVPVHPVCPALLRKAGLSEVEIHAYYTARLDECVRRGEPAVFYGHPIDELDRLPQLFTHLVAALGNRSQNAWRPTLGELFEFERLRRAQTIEVEWNGDSIRGDGSGPAALVVETGGRRRTFTGSELATESGAWQELVRVVVPMKRPDAWAPTPLRAAQWKDRRLRFARLLREVRS